jgi:hypothetical protein
MVPTLQPRVKQVVNYVRGQTWISASFVKERLESLAGKPVSNCKFESTSPIDLPMLNKCLSDKFTEEDKKNFANDEYYRKFRWELESEINVIALSH